MKFFLSILFYIYIFFKIFCFQKPKVSIIIPTYNINNKYYIKKSIDSVLNQYLNNIELIIVDDKATDETPRILDEYALKNKKIIIIHKVKNEMTGYARNTGLDFVMGEYLGFLDYDDLFHPNALLFAYTEGKKKNYTIIHFGYKKFENEKTIITDLKNLNNNYEIEFINNTYKYPIDKTGIYIWSNIYKSSFILSHNFKFFNTWADEDVLFCITIFSYKFDIIIIKKNLVFHRLLSSSIGHNPKPWNERKKLILFYLRSIIKNWEKKGMMKERLIENTFNKLSQSFFKNDIITYIKFLKSFKNVFSEYEIRKLFIIKFNLRNTYKLNLSNELNLNLYESFIHSKIKCFI